MIVEKNPLVNTYISSAPCNCAAFTAGIVRGVLEGAHFPAQAWACHALCLGPARFPARSCARSCGLSIPARMSSKSPRNPDTILPHDGSHTTHNPGRSRHDPGIIPARSPHQHDPEMSPVRARCDPGAGLGSRVRRFADCHPDQICAGGGGA